MRRRARRMLEIARGFVRARLDGIVEVTGSIPVGSTNLLKGLDGSGWVRCREGAGGRIIGQVRVQGTIRI
jgi:hypothetical protein